MNSPVLGFHRRIVRSVDPLASICPSGEKARQRTVSEWPRKILSIRPVSTSQVRIVWSTLPLAATVPSGWYADRKSTRLNSSHGYISYAVFCLKKKKRRDRYNDG